MFRVRGGWHGWAYGRTAGVRGPVKLTDEIVEYIASADTELSGAAPAGEIVDVFGVSLHRRTVERARWR